MRQFTRHEHEIQTQQQQYRADDKDFQTKYSVVEYCPL